MSTSHTLSPALIRTLVPIVVGPLAARFFPGVDIQDPDLLLLTSAVITYVYYVVVRVVEDKFPKAGYFLGIAKRPVYSPEPAPSPGNDERLEAVVVGDDEILRDEDFDTR